MTVETAPPVSSLSKPIATGLTGAALGLSALGSSAAIVTYSPPGGDPLVANDLNDTDSQFEFIDFDLTNLGSITASIGTTDLEGRYTPLAGHLYLAPGDTDNEGTEPPFGFLGSKGETGAIAKTGPLKLRLFEADDLIDADSFARPEIKDSTPEFGSIEADTGVPRYLGLALGTTFATAQFGWVQFTLGSISSSGLAINTTAGQGICAGGIAPVNGNCPSAVPLPPSLALLASGMAGLAAVRRRRRLDS